MTDIHSARTRTAPAFPWLGLIVLSAAVFLSVTDETLPTGLLPEMSGSLGVGEPAVGLLVSVFALTVVVTSTPLIALTRRFPRHALLVTVLALLGVSNILTALAPNYAFVVGTRVLGGVAHGMFWAIVGAYAAHLVAKEHVAKAVSITVAGGTLAFIFGVPVATGLGHVFGWQLAFIGLGALTILGALLVWWLLPRVEPADAAAESHGRAGAASGPRGKRVDPSVAAVLVACILAAVVMIGHYAFYTYVVPFLTGEMHVAAGNVGTMLLIYGIAGAGGLVLSGTVFGRRARFGTVLMLIVTGVAVSVLALFAGQPVVAVVAFLVWGAAFGALPPLLQTGMLHAASPAFRDTASALYTTAFNIGIGGGALVGSVIFAAFGVNAVPWFYVGVLGVALVVTMVFSRQSVVGKRSSDLVSADRSVVRE